MSTPSRLDTVIVFTTDMERLSDFYARGLGLESPNRMPGHIGFELPSGVYLGFDEVDAAPPRGGGVSLWFDVENLEHTFERFRELGATVRYPPQVKPMGDVLASLLDLDGNVFGLVSR